MNRRNVACFYIVNFHILIFSEEGRVKTLKAVVLCLISLIFFFFFFLFYILRASVPG